MLCVNPLILDTPSLGFFVVKRCPAFVIGFRGRFADRLHYVLGGKAENPYAQMLLQAWGLPRMQVQGMQLRWEWP